MVFKNKQLKVAVGVPTMKNFRGLAELFASLWGEDYTPFVVNNWSVNNGVSHAWNEILNATMNYDLTVICNDDIVFWSGAFKELLDFWKNRPNDCLVATASNEEAEILKGAPDYSCWATNSKLHIKEIGLADTNFTPAYFEDNDLHYRIKLSGNEAYRCGARITHKGSQTQNYGKESPVVTSKMFETNREYFIEKWGGNPGEEKFVHPYDDSTRDWRYCR